MPRARAQYVASAAAPERFPRPDLPEVAIAGRSNVGKSSFINALVGTEKLARTSRTPGRTRLINWFRLEPQRGRPFFLVDLPGYGYAKVKKSERAAWGPLVESYLADREVLAAVILLIDARRGAEAEERELCAWLTDAGVAVQIVLTKGDKLSKSRRKPAAAAVARDLRLARPPIVCSAATGEGLVEIWRLLTKAARAPKGRTKA